MPAELPEGSDHRDLPGVLDTTASIILGCVHREYPNKIVHLLHGDDDVRPPRELTPIFFGSFDWHSAVHGHWSLVRILAACPTAAAAERIAAALDRSLTPDRASRELAYASAAGRHGFEMPYGMAWLLLLCADLAALARGPHSFAPSATRWQAALAPLAGHARAALLIHFERLPRPIRTGEHNQTAFGLGLAYDAAHATDDRELAAQVARFVSRHFADDRSASFRFEPSGHDFLSPVLAEADLMRRHLPRAAFADWLTQFLPEVASGAESWPSPVESVDPSDGKLAHFDGLNLSRAWMLDGIRSGLPDGDPRRPELARVAREHGERGRAAVSGKHYAGAHWLGTFLVYWLTRRGVSA
ncbi:MAG: DUF2891 domain-containing protein [Planctomycetota bacterium]